MPDNKEDKRLKEFLNVLRHEINTPLSVIRGYTDLIIEQYGNQLPPDVSKYMETITKNLDRLEESTENMMTIEELKKRLTEEA